MPRPLGEGLYHGYPSPGFLRPGNFILFPGHDEAPPSVWRILNPAADRPVGVQPGHSPPPGEPSGRDG